MSKFSIHTSFFRKLLFASELLVGGCHLLHAQSPSFQHPEALPDYPVKGGVSGCYAGFAGDWLIVAGGCNFPDKPVAEGGKKMYYNKVYALNVDRKPYRWQALPDLPRSVAYGVAVETDKGLVCIGGMNETGSFSDVFRIEMDADGACSYKTLPSLPVTINNHAATGARGFIYVAGGEQEGNGRGVYSLPADGAQTWQKLSDNPGGKRVQPVLLSDGEVLYLAGGFTFDAAAKSCAVPSDMLRLRLSDNQWLSPVSLPSDGHYSMTGGTGVACKGRLVLSGGVDPTVFRDAMEGRGPADYLKKPVDWYRFNKDVLVYSPEEKRWTVLYDIKGVNRAGGVLLHHKDAFYMIGGELKPGIRTASVLRYK